MGISNYVSLLYGSVTAMSQLQGNMRDSSVYDLSFWE